MSGDWIRIDRSIDELLHLTSPAHLSFKMMMSNDCGIEMHRFCGGPRGGENAGCRADGAGHFTALASPASIARVASLLQHAAEVSIVPVRGKIQLTGCVNSSA